MALTPEMLGQCGERFGWPTFCGAKLSSRKQRHDGPWFRAGVQAKLCEGPGAAVLSVLIREAMKRFYRTYSQDMPSSPA